MKLSNSQLNKLKSAIKNKTAVFLRLLSNMIDDDETNFPHKLLLTNRQVANLRKTFADKSSTDVKLSKTELSKVIQSGGFLGRLLGPLLKTGLPLMKNVIQPLTKSVLISLGLTAAVADAGIHKQILGSLHRPSSSPSHNNNNTILTISNDEMKKIVKIVKSLEDSGLLFRGVSETIQNEAKEQRGRFLSMLLGTTLGESLLGNILKGKKINRAGEKVIRAGSGNKKGRKVATKRQDHENKMDALCRLIF